MKGDETVPHERGILVYGTILNDRVGKDRSSGTPTVLEGKTRLVH